MKFSKCGILLKEVIFLGHIVSIKGVMIDPSKVLVVVEWPRVTSMVEVHGFLGLARYYWRFVKDF